MLLRMSNRARAGVQRRMWLGWKENKHILKAIWQTYPGLENDPFGFLTLEGERVGGAFSWPLCCEDGDTQGFSWRVQFLMFKCLYCIRAYSEMKLCWRSCLLRHWPGTWKLVLRRELHHQTLLYPTFVETRYLSVGRKIQYKNVWLRLFFLLNFHNRHDEDYVRKYFIVIFEWHMK